LVRAANLSNQTTTFRVSNITGTRTRFFFTVSCSGFITLCSRSPANTFINGFAFTDVTVTYNTGSGSPPTGTITLTSSDESGDASGSAEVDLAQAKVAITPDSQAVQIPDSTAGLSYLFTVQNTGNTSGTINLTVPTCSAPAYGCTLARSSLTLSGGVSDTVRLTYNSGTVGSVGRIVVHGTVGSLSDDGSIDLAAYVQAPLQNPALAGPGVERRLCLTVVAGPDGASECGDLRLVHGLPRLMTRGKARTPVLLYNSATAHPYVVIADTLTLASVPTNVQATLTFNGTALPTRTWNGGDWSAGATRHIAVGFDALTTATGSYAYSLLLQKLVGGSLVTIRTDTGHVIVVNRQKNSIFRRGWWLAGLDQLIALGDGSKLFVGGDGSARVYRPAAGRSDLWTAPQVDHPDVIQKLAGYYQRLLPGGAKVLFDTATLLHVKTVSRLGDTTSFNWSTGACRHLSAITVPYGPTPTYSFTYGSTESVDGCQQLSSVTQTTAGLTRIVTLARQTDTLKLCITDADTTSVCYRTSAAAGHEYQMAIRINRLGDSTSYDFDAAGKVSQVNQWLAGAALSSTFKNVDTKGLNGATAIDTTAAYTLVDGPRTDVGDSTQFWLDRFGAPWKIRTALGDSTIVRLTRGDPRWPGLVTRLDSPHGRVIVDTYDIHGNVLASTDSSSHRLNFGTTLYATTTYQWDLKWDLPTKITPPEGPLEYTQLAYDLTNGNILWAQDGRGASTRVSFGYGTSGTSKGLVTSMRQPNGATTNFAYDAKGDLASVQDPLGYYIYHTRDALGRDSLVRTQIDAAGTYFERDSTLYNLDDQPLSATKYGPALNGAVAQTLVARLTYDREHRLTTASRWSVPDSNAIGHVTTTYRYDALGRKVAEIAPDHYVDSTYYDAAGNDTLTVTRRGYHIRRHFDALNRLTWRASDSVNYAGFRKGLASLDLATQQSPRDTLYPRYATAAGTYAIPGDTATFTYDASSHLLTANNDVARLTRTYYTNGLDSTETQAIRTWNDTSFSTHVYTLKYSYDLDGRRTALHHPSTLVGAADSTRWFYSNTSGNLYQVVDLLGRVYTFTFDSLNQLTHLDRPGGIYGTYRHFTDGTLSLDSIQNSSFSPNKYVDALLRRTTFTYDARGKVQSAINQTGIKDHPHMTYSGLGYLMRVVDTSQQQVGVTQTFINNESFGYDALGNQTHVTRQNTNFPWPGQEVGGQTGEQYFYRADSTGRLLLRISNGEHDSLTYNEAGDVEFEYDTRIAGTRTPHDRAQFYGADGKLRAVDDRVATASNHLYAGGAYYTFEEYRYDALGRRVLTRSRRYCDMTRTDHRLPCLISFLRRTIWDGSSELDEVQMPAGDAGTTAPAVTDAVMEQDTGYASLVKVDSGGSVCCNDPNPFFGRVAYSYGLSLDQPVAVNRYGYLENAVTTDSAHHFAPYTLSPLWNSNGVVDVAVFGDGGAVTCDPTGGTKRCTRKILWLYGLTAYWRSINDQLSWQGTLLEDKQDASGLVYRRNRYLDPSSGRFTQEDPIGLAGGLNAYGFANGDPVNYADPFGLKPCPPDNDCGPGEWGPILGAGCPAISDACNAAPLIPKSGKEALVKTGVVVGAAALGVAAPALLDAVAGTTAASGTAAAATKLVIQFGKNANQVEHAFRHIDEIGLDRAEVQAAVEQHLQSAASLLQPGKPLNQIIEVTGQRIQYTAFLINNGVINVGRIHPVQ
jgi:RHS repeat-associated protein